MSFKTLLVLTVLGLSAPTVHAKRRCKTRSTTPVFAFDSTSSFTSISSTSSFFSIVVSTTTPNIFPTTTPSTSTAFSLTTPKTTNSPRTSIPVTSSSSVPTPATTTSLPTTATPTPSQCDIQGISSIEPYFNTNEFSDYNSCRERCRQDSQCKAFLPNYQRRCWLYTKAVAQFVEAGGNTPELVYFSDRDCPAKAPEPPKCDIQGLSAIQSYTSTSEFSDYNSCRDRCRQDQQCKAFLPNYQRKCWLYAQNVGQFVSVGGNTPELAYFSDRDCPTKAPDLPRCDIQGLSAIQWYTTSTEFSDYNSCRDWCRQDQQCKAFLPNYQGKCWLYNQVVAQFVSIGGNTGTLAYFSDRDCPAKAPDPPRCNIQGLSATQSYYSTNEGSDYNSCRERCQQDGQCKAFLPNYQGKCWLYAQAVAQFVSVGGNTGILAYFSDKDCPLRPPSCEVAGLSSIQAYLAIDTIFEYNSCRDRCLQDQQCNAFLPSLDSKCRLYNAMVEQFVYATNSAALFSDRECSAK